MPTKQYEMLYIAHPDLEDNLEVISSRVQGLVTARGGEIESEDIWGKRKLAYPINKIGYGVYILLNFSLETDKQNELDRQLRLLDEVLRHMIIIRPVLKVRDEKAKRAPKAPTRPKPEKDEPREPEKSETERMKELDKKLEEIIGADL